MTFTKRMILFLSLFCTQINLIHNVYAESKHELIHLIQVTEEHEAAPDHITFERRKAQLREYYLSGTYEQDVENACRDAIEYFKTIPVTSKSLIVFDIDDTAVFNVPLAEQARFIWPHVHLPRLLPAIEPVLKLYNMLKDAGFKIIFMSGRPTNKYAHTVEELHNAEYTIYEDIILTPARLAIPQWKLAVRKQLSKVYTIVGSVGDRAVDFMGGYTGHEVRLPNYIY